MNARLILAAIVIFSLSAANAPRASAATREPAASIEQMPAPASGETLGYFAKPQYIGNAYCYACHFDLANEFAKTQMGHAFLIAPRTDLERKGCEGCHGPGSNHAILGGGIGVGGLIEFRVDRGQSVERANAACLNCHNENFWHGHTRAIARMACYDCHLVMVHMSPTAQLMPPYVAPWNRARSWALAALLGLIAGVVTGAAARFTGGRRRRERA